MNPFWTSLVNSITSFFEAMPFSGATWFVLATLAFFIWLFVKADKKQDSPIEWEHLIIDSNNNRTSPYKVGYLVGLIVSTWIILTLTDSGELDFDMFGVYLTYLLGGAGVNSFVKRGERNRQDDYGGYGRYDDDMYNDDYDDEPRKYGRRQRRESKRDEPPEYGPSVQDLDID